MKTCHLQAAHTTDFLDTENSVIEMVTIAELESSLLNRMKNSVLYILHQHRFRVTSDQSLKAYNFSFCGAPLSY